jgi:hypothetical protein
MHRYLIKATVLQDSEGNLYLLADEHWGRQIQNACNSVFDQYLYELFDKYKIKRVAIKSMQQITDTTEKGLYRHTHHTPFIASEAI